MRLFWPPSSWHLNSILNTPNHHSKWYLLLEKILQKFKSNWIKGVPEFIDTDKQSSRNIFLNEVSRNNINKRVLSLRIRNLLKFKRIPRPYLLISFHIIRFRSRYSVFWNKFVTFVSGLLLCKTPYKCWKIFYFFLSSLCLIRKWRVYCLLYLLRRIAFRI